MVYTTSQVTDLINHELSRPHAASMEHSIDNSYLSVASEANCLNIHDKNKGAMNCSDCP